MNRTRKARRGTIPTGSTVSVQQDPYSATFLTNVDTASKILNTGDPRTRKGRRFSRFGPRRSIRRVRKN
jgi:hypothetical protein